MLKRTFLLVCILSIGCTLQRDREVVPQNQLTVSALPQWDQPTAETSTGTEPEALGIRAAMLKMRSLC